ncbi:MAG: PIN domain-containing protein, partial [Polyangiaceae bacterium]
REGAKVFVDTDVLVYAHDVDAGRKHRLAAALVTELWESRQGVVSTQVLQELYVTVTRKIAKPLALRRARELVEAYAAWDVTPIDARDLLHASAIEEQHKLSFWDALILAAAKKSGATRVVSEDLNAGQRIEGVRVENHFTKARD